MYVPYHTYPPTHLSAVATAIILLVNCISTALVSGSQQQQQLAAALSCTPTEIARCHVGSLWGMRGPCPLHSCVGLFQSNIHTYIQSV